MIDPDRQLNVLTTSVSKKDDSTGQLQHAAGEGAGAERFFDELFEEIEPDQGTVDFSQMEYGTVSVDFGDTVEIVDAYLMENEITPLETAISEVTADQLKEQILSQSIDSTSETNNHILLNDLKEIIARALEQLSPRQREVFKMSRELQMSHKEIAEALGVSVHTVQEHISLSLKVIRSKMTKYSSTSADVLLLLLCLNL